ncbi:hypothetical protein SPRA44_240179 [Serratia proteamaculans]|nr:hypothetical protein SPRA44_240179 [Serratia proteamaculans]
MLLLMVIHQNRQLENSIEMYCGGFHGENTSYNTNTLGMPNDSNRMPGTR